MKKLYKYTGTIASITYRKNSPDALPFLDLTLHDMGDHDKAPIRIEALGGLADYINSLYCTDAEECYLTADWYYDNMLDLRRIEIPSTEPGQPAKVIAQHESICPTADIFGPSEYIKTSAPSPMGKEQLLAWEAYSAADNYRYTARKADA